MKENKELLENKKKRINQTIRKVKKNFREYLKTVPLKEPVVQLIRRNKRVEFFEDQKVGNFVFEKSDGSTGEIPLDTQFMLTFPIGNDIYRGYILDEDNAFPLPQKPLIHAEQYQASIQKIQNDKTEYKKKMYSEKGEMWFSILKGVAMLIGAVLGIKVIAGLVGVDINIPFLDAKEVVEVIKTVPVNNTVTVFK